MELKDVNIFPGRFQPFHKGHLKCCEDAYKKNGLPTYIMYIHNEKFDAKKPFDDDLTKKELKRLVEKYDYIAGINWIRRPMPITICRVCMENGFRPVLWLCGADRIDSYKKLMQGKSIKDELGIDEPEFMETNRYYSGTEVRNAIKQDDEEKFKEFMPQEAHNLYKEFKSQLDKINENNLTSFIKKSNIKLITEYVNKPLHNSENEVPINIKELIEKTLKQIDFNEFLSIKTDDNDKFKKTRINENLFIKNFKDENFKAISVEEYYQSITNKDFNKLSKNRQADFDSKNGDIILININNENEKYFIDLKISDTHIGSISLESLIKFKDEGIYICLNKSNQDYRIFTHKALYNAVLKSKSKNNKFNLIIPRSIKNSEEKRYVWFNNTQHDKEDYIKGNDIEILFNK